MAKPCLRFTPYAWAKLVFLRDVGDTEVGAFGISSADDLLLIEDLCLIKQECDWASVKFDDNAVADYFDDQVDAGIQPERFARIWIHTHPGDSPRPSMTDEETFGRVFGTSQWAIMFILACGGEAYARIRYNIGPGSEVEMDITIDYDEEFPGSDQDQWLDEYEKMVTEVYYAPRIKVGGVALPQSNIVHSGFGEATLAPGPKFDVSDLELDHGFADTGGFEDDPRDDGRIDRRDEPTDLDEFDPQGILDPRLARALADESLDPSLQAELAEEFELEYGDSRWEGTDV